MELIKNWIFTLCGAFMVASIAKMLLKESKQIKSINVFLSLFLLFYMLAPFSSSNQKSSIDYSNLSSISNIDITENAYKDLIEYSVKEICKEENVNLISCDVNFELNDDECIVKSVFIKIDDVSKSDLVVQKVKLRFGFEVNSV